ncbi:metalloregulator ArsR/SmtB family transcription factor [Dactylosporangium sp. NPDC049140]|jgi:DNA-binding transcriptional ArsR family regulator|uniref:ArsR/SmtB family transcription factor n=1 Tax=Dactylosporangium sp. NPDC049140 TaxID=3155647 RepID=UPI0033EDCDDC
MNLDQVFVALSDPSRRALLQRLAYGPATTGQLAELLPVSRPAVSQHLKVLQDAGLIETEQRGRHRWHRVVAAPLTAVATWATDLTSRSSS